MSTLNDKIYQIVKKHIAGGKKVINCSDAIEILVLQEQIDLLNDVKCHKFIYEYVRTQIKILTRAIDELKSKTND